MTTQAAPLTKQEAIRRKLIALALLAAAAFIAIIIAQLSRYFIGADVVLQPGGVAPQDIRAPRRITFISDPETQRQRELAEAAVVPIYTAPDAQIARQQLGVARDLMNRIAQVRADKTLSDSVRVEQLTALQNGILDQDTATKILAVNDTRWARIDTQVIILLDEVLRFPIRPDIADSVKAQLPNRISLSFNSDESGIITAMASALLVPNTNFDSATTDAAREKARDAVRPVERTFEQNQVIIRSGQVVSQADMEVMDKLNIRRPTLTLSDVIGAVLFAALAVAALGMAMLDGRMNAMTRRLRRSVLTTGVFVSALVLARWLLPGHALLPYIAPLTAVSIIVATWMGTLPAVVCAAVLAGLAGLAMEQPSQFVTFWTVGGIVAALAMRKAERISDYMRAGSFAWLAQLGVVLAFNVTPFTLENPGQLISLLLVTTVGGLVASALAPALLYLAGLLLDITTPFQLHELSRPSHPLIRKMMLHAPGTYHHSLMLANLAEHAAEGIGADSLLTRVGAYYHDIGKIAHPYFFIENQVGGQNVHEQLDPQTSSRILQNHVSDGLDMARKYHLPTRIRAFISEHHGTSKTGYQYVRASQASNEPVDDAPFRYPGPRPQSKETALVMLSDGCEAIVRAKHPNAVEETDALLRKVISEKIADHQLDDTQLTLQELEVIRQSFLDTLRGAYHPRIEYPELNRPGAQQQALPVERLSEAPPTSAVKVNSENA